MSSEYKANRKGMPDDLAAQMPVVKEILDLWGVSRMELSGYEADDLIGTLSRMGEQSGMDVFIFSGDHDDFQLISDRVSVVMPQSGKDKDPRVLFNRAKFEETYGVKPEVFVQVKALMGDNSDNIKGVEKVGEKTAFKLIAEYGDCKGVMENADKLSPALGARIANAGELLDLNIKLCTIDRDAPVPFGLDETKFTGTPSDTQALYDRLSALSLKMLIKKLSLDGMQRSEASVPAAPMDEISSGIMAKLEKLLGEGFRTVMGPCDLPKGDLAAGIDFVTTSSGKFVLLLDYDNAVLYCMTPDEAKSVFAKGDIIPAAYGYKDRSKQIDEPLACVRSVFDIEIAGYVMNLIEGKSDLERLYEYATGSLYPVTEEKTAAVQLSLFDEPSSSVSLEDELKKAGKRLCCITAAARMLSHKLEKEERIRKLLYDIEFPLVITLDKIERAGMHVSRERLDALHEEYTRRLEDIAARIFDMTGVNFNINSPKQLGDVLYGEKGLNLPHGKKGKNGLYSTGIDELNRLREYHPVIEEIIKYRELSKLDSTYAAGLVRSIRSDDRIHTTFTQAMTNTGRLSSTEPNLQNIPVRSDEGSRLREAFTASEGCVLVDADYSQIELRLLASLSGDEIMCSAFNEGEDIHRRTAAKVFGVNEDAVTHKMRSIAKTVNFSIIYGISDYGLATDLGIGYKEAGTLIKEYENQFPGIMKYLNGLKENGEKNGFVETEFGRKRILSELKSQNRNVRNFGFRAAMNTPIQGTAADIIKIAMIRVDERLRREGLKSRLILQIHDELLVETAKDEVEKVKSILREEMSGAADLAVPLEIGMETGDNWYDAH
jgi:DNA polymerase-1